MINEALKEILFWEGEYSNDPQDSGGETIYGITKRDYPVDFKKIKEAYQYDKIRAKVLAKQFYTRVYYNPLYEKIDKRLAIKLMSLNVNMGARAIKLLQEGLNEEFGENLEIDGNFGQKTLKACNRHQSTYSIYIYKCTKFYEGIVRKRPTNRKYFHGWLNRLYN